jgi:hypothetical protein
MHKSYEFLIFMNLTRRPPLADYPFFFNGWLFSLVVAASVEGEWRNPRSAPLASITKRGIAVIYSAEFANDGKLPLSVYVNVTIVAQKRGASRLWLAFCFYINPSEEESDPLKIRSRFWL